MIVIDKTYSGPEPENSRNVKFIIFSLTCTQVKNIKILITRFFLIGDQLVGWVNLIISVSSLYLLIQSSTLKKCIEHCLMALATLLHVMIEL